MTLKNLAYDWIGENPLTGAMAVGERQDFSSLSELVVKYRGDYLFRAEESSSYLYVIHSGELFFERYTVDGHRTILNMIFSGDIIGFSGGDTYQGSVKCVTDVIASKISTQDYAGFIAVTPSLDRAVRTKLFHYMMWQQNHIYMLGHQKAEQLLCYLFMLLNSESGSESGSVPNVVSINLSRSEMAGFLGLRKETVIRAFKSLAEKGVIEIINDIEIRLTVDKVGRLIDFL